MKTFTSSVWGMEVVVTTDDNNLITNVTSEGEQMNTGFTNEDGEFECWSEGEFEELVEDLSESYGEEFTFIVGVFKKVFTTQTEVREFLVANGIHAGLARAIVCEYLEYDNEEGNDNLQRYNEETGEAEAYTMTEEEVLDFMRTNGDDDFEVMEDGIYFDGEHTHDLQGFHI